MFELFSNRELAGIFVIFIGIIFVLIVMLKNKKSKELFLRLVKIIFSKKMVLPYLICIIYGGLIILIFSNMKFWKVVYTKDCILWIIFVGIPFCFNAVLKCEKENYFRDIVTDNIKFTVIFEILFNTVSFSLIIEIILTTILIVLIFLRDIAKLFNNIFYEIASKILMFIYLILLIATIGKFIKQELVVEDVIVSVLIPIVLSLFYIPIAYMFALYSKYEDILMRLKYIKSYKNNVIVDKYKIILFKTFKFSIKKIQHFKKIYIHELYAGRIHLDEAIREFKNRKNKI